ncbi:MAG: hypothetical protein LBH54_00420, partial [Clostridiales bacterium]|nr:hypothetical protein [Clostridiales bacterium]
MSSYQQMKADHRAEISAFPMFFAFDEKQFYEGMSKLGLAPDDTDKICKLGSMGGFLRKSDASSLREMFDRHEKELADAIAADQTGDGFTFDMFMYELGNHEYTYTGDTSDTLDALGFSEDDMERNPALRHGLEKACEAQWAC